MDLAYFYMEQRMPDKNHNFTSVGLTNYLWFPRDQTLLLSEKGVACKTIKIDSLATVKFCVRVLIHWWQVFGSVQSLPAVVSTFIKS